jgi:Flp pilus assembly protein TadD
MALAVPEFLQPWLGSSPRAAQLFYGGVAVGGLLLLLALWLLLGRGPRRRRAWRRAQRLLQQGAWSDAVALVREQQNRGPHSATWQKRLDTLEGDCLHAAAETALQQHNFEDALGHALRSAELLKQDQAAARTWVVEAMLAEVRRLFATSSGKDTQAVHDLIGRTLILQSECPEAHFWKGLCHFREGQAEQAVEALQQARSAGSYIDPPLYHGAHLLRQGRAAEALRTLSEASRIDANCPVVTLQLGAAMIAAGSDPQFAVRTLQRALGQRGLAQWQQEPQRAWVEGFPDGRSYVRRLAAKHPYHCPFWGGDLQLLLRQGNLALAQGLYRGGNFQEAADLYHKLLQETAPTLPVLRGLGLSLARLERYDQAFKHLRAAQELEQPRDPLTAGYLALCGARGKPARPEDRPLNVQWSVRMVCKFHIPGDAEWAGLCSKVFAEARSVNLELAVEDQVNLCDLLVSVRATDALAADAYHHLAATHPEALKAEYAWLYCRAAQQQKMEGDHALQLYALAFRDEKAARAFFAAQGWDFEEVQYLFLERAAALQPGEFPAVLGEDYPARGEALLLERSCRQEAAGDADAALNTAEVLIKLSPRSPLAHDHLARLCYRRAELDRAIDLLRHWAYLAPLDPWPYVRRAVIDEQRGSLPDAMESIEQALRLTKGRRHADIAFLGARLALHSIGEANDLAATDARQAALDLLQKCLRADANHADALWVLAAVRSADGDLRGLAELAPALKQPAVADARFHYLATVCHLAAGDNAAAIEASRRAATDPALAVESAYLRAWAHWQRDELAEAAEAFQPVAAKADSPSAGYAQALLARVAFARGDYEEAVRWWQALAPESRAAWRLDEPLRATVFLAALQAFENGQYEQAANRLREAGKLGLRDRRLGQLMTLALVKAGQRLLYQETVMV